MYVHRYEVQEAQYVVMEEVKMGTGTLQIGEKKMHFLHS